MKFVAEHEAVAAELAVEGVAAVWHSEASAGRAAAGEAAVEQAVAERRVAGEAAAGQGQARPG